MTRINYLERCAWDSHRNDMAFLDAHDRWRAARAALPERQRLDALADRSDALLERRCEARDAAAVTPVHTPTDLLAKFDFLEEAEFADGNGFEVEEWRASLRADLARLVAGGLN